MGMQLEQRPVTVGLQDYTSAQILSGLMPGNPYPSMRPADHTGR